MAIPVYSHDLVDITLAESTTGFTALGGGASGLGFGPDYGVQGTGAVDKQVTGTTVKGMVYDNGAAITPGASEHFFIWLFPGTPGTMTSLATGGLRATLGSATTAYNDYYLHGNDTLAKGGARCYPIRYAATTPSPGSQTGTPAAQPRYFGGQMSTNGTVKGSNFGVDAIRRGTGAYITAGDVTTPATFLGYAAQNDNTTNQWGVLTLEDGVYKLQGRFVVGQNSSKVATLARFDGTNAFVVLTDTPHTQSDFTQIIVDHASTVFNLTNCTFKALGTVNKGRLVYNNASTVSTLSGVTFEGMDLFTLRAGVSVTGCTWRQCGAITQNGATISGSLLSRSTAAIALTLNDITSLDTTTFVSAGTGHAISGFTTAGSYTLNGLLFTGYAGANGSTGNEAIHVTATTGTVNLTVAGGGNTPSIRTSGAIVNVISGSVNATVKVTTTAGVNIASANVFLKASSGGPFPVNAVVTIVNSGTTATVTHTGHPYATNDKVLISGANLIQNRGVYTITVTGSNTYTYTMGSAPGASPTGTITSTYVLLFGLTNASGVVTMGRVFPSDQPVTGWARKSTTQPFYKTGGIGGTVSSTSGLNTTIQLLPD